MFAIDVKTSSIPETAVTLGSEEPCCSANPREETEAGLGRPLEAGDDRNAPCGEESPNDNGTPFPEGVQVFSSDAVADLPVASRSARWSGRLKVTNDGRATSGSETNSVVKAGAPKSSTRSTSTIGATINVGSKPSRKAMVSQVRFLSHNQALRRAAEQLARFSWWRPLFDDLRKTTERLHAACMASAVLLRIILAEMKRDITGLRWSVNAEDSRSYPSRRTVQSLNLPDCNLLAVIRNPDTEPHGNHHKHKRASQQHAGVRNRESSFRLVHLKAAKQELGYRILRVRGDNRNNDQRRSVTAANSMVEVEGKPPIPHPAADCERLDGWRGIRW